MKLGKGFAVLVFLLSATAIAQDAAPPAAPPKPAAAAPADPLATEVEAIRRLVATGLWKAGKTSIDKFFAAHAGDPRVLAHLASLESDLEKCLFRLASGSLTPLELLGRCATKYEPGTNKVEFRVCDLTEDAGWRSAGDVRFFDALFDGEVSVEMSADTALATTVLLGFDSETRGAYAFVPAQSRYGMGIETYVYRLDPGSTTPFELGTGDLIFPGGSTLWVRFAITPSRLTVEVQQTKSWGQDAHHTQNFADGKYKRGFVAVSGAARLDAKGLLIKGKLDAMFAKRQIAEADSRRFRAWEKANWDRRKALPAAVLELEKTACAWASEMPVGCAPEWRDDLVELQRAAFEAPGRAREMKPVCGLASPTAEWQDALFAYAERRHADAEAAARAVIAAAPEFAPAYALVGRALLGRGDDAAALPLFEESRRRDPKFAPAYDGLALVAFRDGDAVGMQNALSDQAAAGVSSALSAELRQVALRLKRGPDWKKRFDSFSTNYAVSGDASTAICNEIAKTLEEAADVYGREFRRRPKKTRGRVRVFSGFESYADYVSDIGCDPSHTLGVYLPSMRELCVFLHEDRPELSNTIRHEGFHQYLHDFLDDVPIWFNEGYAEFFGFSRRVQGKAVVGQVGEDQAELAKRLLPKFAPIEKLMLMEPEEFMADAGVHYVESWAVIHLLRTEATFKGVLDRYFDALLAGKSQKEAYDAVFAPMAASLDNVLKSHVASLASR